MKNLIIGIILFALIALLSFFGINIWSLSYYVEWATKFILPWVILYWLIRLVKSFEDK